MNVANNSVAFSLGYTANLINCIFIYTISIHIVYMYCVRVFVYVCCDVELTSCFVIS